MFKDNADGTFLFIPNRLWETVTYVLPNKGIKDKICRANTYFSSAITVVIMAAIATKSLALFVMGLATLFYVYSRYNKQLLKGLPTTTSEKISFRSNITSFVNSKKTFELWIILLAFLAFVIYQIYRLSNAVSIENIVLRTVVAVLFSVLSAIMVYALILKRRK